MFVTKPTIRSELLPPDNNNVYNNVSKQKQHFTAKFCMFQRICETLADLILFNIVKSTNERTAIRIILAVVDY